MNKTHGPHILRRKSIILTFIMVAALAAMIPLAASHAGGGLLSSGTSSVTGGESMQFTANLGAIPDDTEDYTLSVNVSPTPSSFSVSESVGASISGGSCSISSANISGSTLHFTVKTSEVTSDTTYTVSAKATSGGSTVSSDSFSFTVKAQEQETTESGTDETTETATTETSQTRPNVNKMKGAGSMVASGNTGSVSSSTSNVTYKGSSDNYLDVLSVSGYTFSQKFNKTNDTYFITASKGTKQVSVKATPSDSSADVAITGSDQLQSGRNKIMISVTADNGDVRVYRIYVDVD